MLEVVNAVCEVYRPFVQTCLDGTAVQVTRGLEKSTLLSSQWMIMVLAMLHCGPSRVQVPQTHLSTDGESRPLTLPGRTLADHHHPLLQEEPTQGLVPPLGGGFDSEDAETSAGITPPSMAPKL
jgi:hypothetical protein